MFRRFPAPAIDTTHEENPLRPTRLTRASATAIVVTSLLLGTALSGSAAPSVPAVTAAVEPAGVVAANPYERGPAPTRASIEASRGSFATATTTVSRTAARSFGGGTIYYPSTTTAGTFGAVAISPGYTASQSSISWLGPRLASQGFVVITIDTLSRYDQPSERGDQLNAALTYLTQSSSVRDRIDPTRLAVMGHSMGGGGTLEAAKDNPALQATIGMTPYNLDKTWPEVTTPSLIIGAQNDSVAPVGRHAIPFYNGLTNLSRKAYVELRGASHYAPNTSNTTIAATSISWLKRFVDDDLRYSQFLCPAPGTSTAVADYRTPCGY